MIASSSSTSRCANAAPPLGERLAGHAPRPRPRWRRCRASSSARCAGSRARPRRRTPRRARRDGSGRAPRRPYPEYRVPQVHRFPSHVASDTSGARIWAHEQGEGDPILFIGGLGDPIEVWQAQIDAFAAEHRVIAHDNRGAGRSPAPVRGREHRGDGRRRGGGAGAGTARARRSWRASRWAARSRRSWRSAIRSWSAAWSERDLVRPGRLPPLDVHVVDHGRPRRDLEPGAARDVLPVDLRRGARTTTGWSSATSTRRS